MITELHKMPPERAGRVIEKKRTQEWQSYMIQNFNDFLQFFKDAELELGFCICTEHISTG
jgi:hypothetical protein